MEACGIKLRGYQEECIDDCIKWVKSTTSSGVVDATVSFGKSIVIAELARRLVELSRKKVLVMCPDGNLVSQNSEKLKSLGVEHSIFSASLNQKSTRHDIVIGTPQSIKNKIRRFGGEFSSILIDEGDGITNSIRSIVGRIKEHNDLVRVIGFTGTPYRTKTGYIYQPAVAVRPCIFGWA